MYYFEGISYLRTGTFLKVWETNY